MISSHGLQIQPRLCGGRDGRWKPSVQSELCPLAAPAAPGSVFAMQSWAWHRTYCIRIRIFAEPLGSFVWPIHFQSHQSTQEDCWKFIFLKAEETSSQLLACVPDKFVYQEGGKLLVRALLWPQRRLKLT